MKNRISKINRKLSKSNNKSKLKKILVKNQKIKVKISLKS